MFQVQRFNAFRTLNVDFELSNLCSNDPFALRSLSLVANRGDDGRGRCLLGGPVPGYHAQNDGRDHR